MKRIIIIAVMVCVLAAQAHFQVLLPSRDIVSASDERRIELKVQFTHPMEQGPLMTMGQPHQFGVLIDGVRHDLLAALTRRESEGVVQYSATHELRMPAGHIFFLEPAPYWEAAEQKMIVHYTKVVVDAFDAGTGWDAMVGFPVEIEPLVRPYGLWTGNLFRGIVRHNGEPVPFAEIEVEYYNEGGKVRIPSGPFVTQVIKADAHGLFAYAMPRAGWWGFAALVEGAQPMKNPDGDEVEVELGGLIWVRCVDME